VNAEMNLRVPQNAGKFLSSCTIGGFSRSVQLHEVSIYLSCTNSTLNMPYITSTYCTIVIVANFNLQATVHAYGLSPSHITHALLQSIFTYCHQTESSHGRHAAILHYKKHFKRLRIF
jgi:hypothetical protein